MKEMTNVVFGDMIIDVGHKVKEGKCGLDKETIEKGVRLIGHRKMYIGEICNEYDMSARTLERRVAEGKMPKWHKEPSGKKYMYKDEIDFMINNE